MSDIQQHDTIVATFSPRRTDDLALDFSPPIGWRGRFDVAWEIDHGPYDGEWACVPRELCVGWVPSGDLTDIVHSEGDAP